MQDILYFIACIPHGVFNQFPVVRHFILFIIIHYYNRACNEYPCNPTTQLIETAVSRHTREEPTSVGLLFVPGQTAYTVPIFMHNQ